MCGEANNLFTTGWRKLVQRSETTQFTHSSPDLLFLEDKHPDHQSVLDLATAGVEADMRHRENVLNVRETLDNLRIDLLEEGFALSRQTL